MEITRYIIKNKATGKYLKSMKRWDFAGDSISKTLENCFDWSNVVDAARVYNGLGSAKNSVGYIFRWQKDRLKKRRILSEHLEFVRVKLQVVAE